MITPAGTACKFYYEDFNRGRDIQECRLIGLNPRSGPWKPLLCKTCPVPAILRANACSNMVLEARVVRKWLLVKRVEVEAYCTLTRQRVADPMVGCGRCHEQSWQDILDNGEQRDRS
jgi:hypothetical protein